ncbi:MAG: acyltransferase [Alphaproteobacteria bacterium]|nr:acyltransferase [Alphaproteobacteria bacterium]
MSPRDNHTVRKVGAIEGLRGLLACWVVLGHMLPAAGLGDDWRGPFKVIAFGGYAVDVFIIVSGFVIFYLLDTARETYGRFLWRRALRLYPLYLVCLLASLAVIPLQIEAYANAPWPHPHNLAVVAIDYETLRDLPQHLAAHLLMAHGLLSGWLLPYGNYAILGQAWSLSLEWQFYVVAPLFAAAFLRGTMPTLVATAVACALYFLVTGNEGFLPRHIPLFAFGIASYYLWRERWQPRWALAPVVGVALAYLLTGNPPLVIWSAVLLAILQPRGVGSAVVRRVLEAPPVMWLGRISYPIYLVHNMVLTAALLGLERVGAARFGQWPFVAMLAALTFGGTLVVASLLHRGIEMPCIALGRRRARVAVRA